MTDQPRPQDATPNRSADARNEHFAPSISADFLTGSTEVGLDRIRTRLLDLTNRNRLLNFRYPKASSLRVVGVSIDDVFRQLVDNQKLAFLPVPEPDSDEGDRPSATEYAQQLGWSTSYDLDESTSEPQTSSSLPVLLYPEQLDTLGRKISSAAKTAIEESGTNMLYLVFGFLEWYESDDSNLPHFAPLVTLPVTIERSGGKGKSIDSILEYSGEDIETNLSLVEKLRRDFGLETPDLKEEDTPEQYFPKESLGVVTLNAEQKDLMEELLDRKLRDDPAAIAYQEQMTGGQETFFVKNLENVQGDERDVIFISTTYGPDARGNQFQRFGPINGPNGHRRLNVLFTRAKRRIVVFSSLDPDRIQTTANSPWGVRALKKYLIYARTGILQQPDHGADEPANDFEQSVGNVLRDKGYEGVPQVGVAGFFIDLGVKHPAKPGAFLLGIECDGAGYHSARSARDRDRLRQENLENLGWKIHRIWSTDWFKSRDSEIKRLLRRIEELLASDPVYRLEKDKVHNSESLRQRLIALRETEIKPEFLESPLETGLLRKSLLEEFVQKRPKTRDDWFRKIPQHLRVSVESKQVGKYLDRVLGIIAESRE